MCCLRQPPGGLPPAPCDFSNQSYRSWQTLPPPGATITAPGQYNYAPIHDQAIAVQEMGYTAYDRLNKEVRWPAVLACMFVLLVSHA